MSIKHRKHKLLFACNIKEILHIFVTVVYTLFIFIEVWNNELYSHKVTYTTCFDYNFIYIVNVTFLLAECSIEKHVSYLVLY